jgi:methylthioribose-1-phosphate isomerase
VIELRTLEAVCEAIHTLRVRGAPALGVAGAYGVLVAVQEKWGDDEWEFHSTLPDSDVSPGGALAGFPASVTIEELRARLDQAARTIAGTRPTAVNLKWAVDRMAARWRGEVATTHALLAALLAEADAIHREDLEMCRALGAHGAALIADGAGVLTHCNTGGLATSGYGTALGVVFAAVEAGKSVHVFADETRPLLQGARLTAWECKRNGIPVTVLVEGAAATLLSRGDASCVLVGADRIAANGDVANKVGTLAVAVLAQRFGVPFYVAAPSSTIDPSIPGGSAIPIEQREADEVRRFAGVATAPDGVPAFNPAFDVTPAELVAAIITENGIVRPPYRFT